jgi:hypothetical protein
MQDGFFSMLRIVKIMVEYKRFISYNVNDRFIMVGNLELIDLKKNKGRIYMNMRALWKERFSRKLHAIL